MEHVTETIMKLIGSEVCGSALCLPSQSPFSDAFLIELYNVAKSHEVAHLVGSALINNKLLAGSSVEDLYHEQVYTTVFRYEKMNFVLQKVCAVLESAKIPYIPLKGAVIRERYPQPWMRTSCDIDVLVHEEDLEAAAKAITEALGYVCKGRGKHDVSILSAENIYIELHFTLLEDDISPNSAKVLDKVWEYAKPIENGSYKHELDDAMFYFYHIAHMAKHFTKGGCGLRPFLDLWLIERSKNYHTAETKALLKKGRLTDFAETATRLSEVWFSGEENNEITLLMQEFIMNGGCFGSAETKMLSSQQRSGGKLKYIVSRIFVPYDDLKGQYPIIKKHRFLTPICEICRLFSLLFGKRKRFRKSYLGRLNGVSEEHVKDINYLFESVGLS